VCWIPDCSAFTKTSDLDFQGSVFFPVLIVRAASLTANFTLHTNQAHPDGKKKKEKKTSIKVKEAAAPPSVPKKEPKKASVKKAKKKAGERVLLTLGSRLCSRTSTKSHTHLGV
jgi:hypothetical protein